MTPSPDSSPHARHAHTHARTHTHAPTLLFIFAPYFAKRGVLRGEKGGGRVMGYFGQRKKGRGDNAGAKRGEAATMQ